MKGLTVVLIVLAVIFGGWKLWDYWDTVNQQKEAAEKTPEISEDQMGRMSYELEQSLQEARKKGPSAVKAWLNRFEKSPKIPEDRLAWIKLDYVLTISQSDPLEAKKVFAEVKSKVSTSSKVYPRVQKLEKTYN
jgi:hypothetical protein